MGTDDGLQSLTSTRKGTHVDFVRLHLTNTVDEENLPWVHVHTKVDIVRSHSAVEAALSALDSAGRSVVSVTPVPDGHAAFLQFGRDQTGWREGKRVAYGYSYTGTVMIISQG